MALAIDVDNLLVRAREKADLPTADEANSFVTDARLMEWLNEGYRKLYRLLSNATGVLERFMVSAALTSPYALPADFMRDIGLDLAAGTPLQRYTFAERHHSQNETYPRWKVQAGFVVFSPSTAAPASVTLHYIPTPDVLAAAGSFNSFEGYDDYLVDFLVKNIKAKEELDLTEINADLQADAILIMTSAALMYGGPAITVADTEGYVTELYFNG